MVKSENLFLEISSQEIINKLEEKAKVLRCHVIEMVTHARSGHVGGSLSAADLVSVLFFHKMRYDPKNPSWDDRDRFVLSKGHCCPVIYAALAEAGFFSPEYLLTLRQLGSSLQGHPDRMSLSGIEASTGSLGQGLSIANGMAAAAKLDKKNIRVYVLLGDGECHEGNIWEAAMFSSHHKLDNLTAILDCNKQQIDGWIKDIKNLEPLAEKWRAFGWHIIEINGHNISEIIDALDQAEKIKEKPSIIIANTVKGKGVSFMECNLKFHGTAPTEEEAHRALKELS
jgi:transketolase